MGTLVHQSKQGPPVSSLFWLPEKLSPSMRSCFASREQANVIAVVSLPALVREMDTFSYAPSMLISLVRV